MYAVLAAAELYALKVNPVVVTVATIAVAPAAEADWICRKTRGAAAYVAGNVTEVAADVLEVTEADCKPVFLTGLCTT